jgi:SAM-dependent methyltransferase
VTADRLTAHRDADYLLDDLVAAEEWHFWFRARRDLVLWAIQRHVPAARTVLEVGCGAGFVLSAIRDQDPQRFVIGCDRSVEALRRARQRDSRVPVFEADVRQLPLARQFDLILALDVIEHVDEDHLALAEMYRLTRPGGSLLLTVPQHRWLWSQVDEFSCHRRRYDRRELAAKVADAGFGIVHATSCFATTVPFALVARRRPRRAEDFDPSAELRLSALTNAVLRGLLAPEWMALKRGLSLPIGSSLLLVARRPAR